jgi:protein-disulfide isomerase
MKSMSKNTKTINYALIGVIFVIVVGVISMAVFYFKNYKNAGNDNFKTEEEEIIDANSEALNGADSQLSGEVPPISEDEHVLGLAGAPIKFIIYSDFDCPFCAEFNETVKQAEKEFAGSLLIAYRHFPLASHANAMTAAIASECADEQGKFWEMHDKLFEDNTENKMGAEEFKKDAEELGLDLAQFNQCLETEKYKDKVNAQMLAARNAGILGAPQSYINGQPIPGAYQYEDFTDSGGFARKGLRNIILENMGK